MTVCAACLRRLKKAETDFCAACRQELFDGTAVPAVLPFAPPATATEEQLQQLQQLRELTRQISVSGVQEKFSLRLAREAEEPHLALTARGGQYILKPVPPTRFRDVNELPANEHFTMQLARQVFKLPTAACAVLRFADGSPAYLTRRFDVQPNGLRLAQEDFAQLGGRTEQEHGDNYKYDFSHEEMARLIRQHLADSYVAELTYFFRLTLFNYLVSNGDAHLKNFSLYRQPGGEYGLTPGYDLLNTSLHVQGGNGLALDLFADDYETPSFVANAYLAYDDFLEFGIRIGLPISRVRRVLADMAGHEAATEKLLARSFLPPARQAAYAASLASRRQRLRCSLAGRVS
ncbi:HipA domain-containing protein [Hymenobacter sp. H14-R3]|uniref:HipA domain-containing protein n=1 Tax=Hymenobacter sp. H14-R3 TaxID=3046308 RepID=UPI0024BA4FC6|nr:HipA domain-containing protein [Hymenobacter sp. H14-R3]MDJ0364286.1 HipA domain-containing protein [Hymenobacter sp. H14-R3]